MFLLFFGFCLCLACCIRHKCRKLFKKKGVKGGKGIDLQHMKSIAFKREKVRENIHSFIYFRESIHNETYFFSQSFARDNIRGL